MHKKLRVEEDAAKHAAAAAKNHAAAAATKHAAAQNVKKGTATAGAGGQRVADALLVYFINQNYQIDQSYR